MSSGIEKNVPLFTGDDYPGWSVSMESYLMASGVKGTPEALRTLEKVVASGLVRDESLLSRITEADDSRFYDETPNNSGEEEDEEDDDEEDERAAKRFKSLDLRNRIGEV